MCQGPNACQHGWAKQLTPSCPPADSVPPEDGEVAYLFVYSTPPTPGDFRSKREKFPNSPPRTKECQYRAISMWVTEEKVRSILKFPIKRGQGIAKVALGPDCGALERRADGHISWWQCRGFDAVAASEEVMP